MRLPVRAALPAVLLLSLAAVPLAAATPAPPCTSSPQTGDGGDWPRGGRDAANTRNQDAEQVLKPANAGTLQPAWTFDTGHPSGDTAGGLADLNSTPVVAGGCVFLAGATGSDGQPDVWALDARTGALVWQAALPASPAGLGGAVVGSPLVTPDKVVVLVNQLGDGGTKGPYVAALDRSTGAVVWRSAPVTTGLNDYTNATPALGLGTVVAGFSGEEGNPASQGGVGLVDLATGAVLARVDTVPPDQQGTYAGGGVWTTPAVDESTGYAYYGTGNPFTKKVAYPTTDAILKLDLDRSRPTFGQVVAFTSGEPEQANELLRTATRPSCDAAPDPVPHGLPLGPFQGLLGDSYTCGQLDLDFGAAPNLFSDPTTGALLVGDLQKSGWYHEVDAATMQPVRAVQLGVSCNVCNASSTAYDGERGLVGAVASPGSVALAFTPAGQVGWRSPLQDAAHYEPVTLANGVMYTLDLHGFLHAWDVETGKVLLLRSLLTDAGTDAAAYDSSSGVAVAYHTVYAAAGNHLVAYRLP